MTNPTADHPHTGPGDGRTECDRCGKFVFPAIHSCKGVPVTPAAQARWAAATQAAPPDDRCTDPNPHGPHEHYGEPASIRRDCPERGTATPYTDADVTTVAGAIAASWAYTLAELSPEDSKLIHTNARGILDALAAAGRLAAAGCPCTCHQPGRCPCGPSAPEHHHGAGGYCTVAEGHVLVVDAIGWVIHHPPGCTVAPRSGGPSFAVCLIGDTAQDELASNALEVGRYEVSAADEPDYTGRCLRIGDRLPDDAPLPAGARTASTCRCEDAEGRRWDHPHGTGLVCGEKVPEVPESTWRPARPGDTPGELVPEHGPTQPVDLPPPAHDHSSGVPLFAPDAQLEVHAIDGVETWTGAEWNEYVTAATRNRNGVAERLVRCPNPVCTTTCPAAATEG